MKKREQKKNIFNSQQHFKIQPQVHLSRKNIDCRMLVASVSKWFLSWLFVFNQYTFSTCFKKLMSLKMTYAFGLPLPLFIPRCLRTAPHLCAWKTPFSSIISLANLLSLESFLSDPFLLSIRRGIKSGMFESMGSEARIFRIKLWLCHLLGVTLGESLKYSVFIVLI